MRLCVVLVGVLSSVFAELAFGQLGTATFSGVVSDPSGANIVGAAVTATNSATGFVRQTLTNQLGQYNLPGLVPGPYDLRVESPGFKRTERRGLTLQVDQNARIDVTLEVGQVTESVEITAQAPLVESQSATLGAVVDNQKILALPLNGRNFAQLAQLVPGVTSGTGAGGAGGFSANGLRADQNAFQIDGTSNSDSLGNQIAFTPNIDAIGEFKIQTSNYSAEFGKGAGAQVNIVTKSGTREFHGTLWEFVRNDALQARRFFDRNSRSFPCDPSDPNLTGRAACAPPFNQNQFGFNVSGPLALIPARERKTFFFATYEGFRQRRGAAVINQVPTIAQRQGDFSQNLLAATAGTDALGRTWGRGQIFDPFSSRAVTDSSGRTRFVREAFPNNQIPVSSFDPVAARIISNTTFVPLPNSPGITVANGNTNENWLDGRSNRDDNNEISARIDHQFTPNDTVFGRLNYNNSDSYSPGTFPGFGTLNDTRNYNATISYTKVITPSIVSETRLGFQGRFSENGAEDGIAGTDWIGQLGIRGLSHSRESGILGSPVIAVTNYASWGNGTGPTTQENYTFQPMEVLSFNKGRHFMKIGGEMRRAHQNMVRPDRARGNFSFSGPEWTGIDGVANTGHTLASFLLGLSRQKSRLVSDFLLQFRLVEWGGFFQDDFKVSRSLTLNFGVRYMYYTPPYDVRDAFSSFVRPVDCPNFTACSTVFNTTPVNPFTPYFGLAGKDLPRSLTQTDKKNFGPRFGFAWQPFGSAKTVIRGGYGIFYDTVPTSINADSLWNYPQVIEDQQDLALGQFGMPTSEGFIGFLVDRPSIEGKSIADFNPGPNNFHRDFRNAYIQNWNFTIQRELPGQTVVEVAYVGNKGTRLQRQENTNTAEPLGPRAEIPDLTNNTGIRSDIGPGRNQFRRLLPFAVQQGVIIPLSNSFEETSTAFSNYHGVNLRFEKRRSHGLSYIATYTFGKAMSDSPGFGGGGQGQAGRIQNILDKRAEKGLADLDHRHRFTVAAVYELPFGRGRRFGAGWRGPLNAIGGGWALDSIVTLQSGLPITVRRVGDPGSQGAEGILRPDIIAGCDPDIPRGQQTVDRFFNIDCFVAPESLIPGDMRYGTAGRGTVQGPGIINTDFSVRKETNITEKVRTEFRAEFFNFFNHANWSPPTRDLGNSNLGRITNTADPRIVQFALKLYF